MTLSGQISAIYNNLNVKLQAFLEGGPGERSAMNQSVANCIDFNAICKYSGQTKFVL